MADSSTSSTSISMPTLLSHQAQRKPVTHDGSDLIKATPSTKSASSTRFVKGSTTPKPPNNDGTGVMALLNHPINVLLIAWPLGTASYFLNWGDVPTFGINFLALIPLAKVLGDATEELAAGLKDDMLAGLLNATFGNAVEVVLTIATLRAGMIEVVKASLLGSVLSNLLLVMGMSFFCGGIVANKKADKPVASQNKGGSTYVSMRDLAVASEENELQSEVVELQRHFSMEKVQKFSVMTALVNTSMLLLSSLSFSLVSIFCSQSHIEAAQLQRTALSVSRYVSIILMVAYVAYIFFQLVTHREAMSEEEGGEEGAEGEEQEEPSISIPASVFLMIASTLVVAFASELLVNSLEGVVDRMGINEHFIGIILLPIVGNACEHMSAVRFAMQDKPGLSVGIAVGSSTQISLFVVPFSVIVGWCMGQPMDLNFGALNAAVMSISVVVFLSVIVDGSANWLQGYLLMSAYFIIAVLYWYLPTDSETALA